jgi:hypothetical protein
VFGRLTGGTSNSNSDFFKFIAIKKSKIMPSLELIFIPQMQTSSPSLSSKFRTVNGIPLGMQAAADSQCDWW